MDDTYDTYYSGIVDDIYDYDPYQKWSDESSECYKAWSETSSAIYRAWSDMSSTLYRQYSAISSGLYRGEYDIDSIWEEYQKKLALEEAEKNLEDVDSTVSEDANEISDTSADTTSSKDSESSSGIRPEFLKAMESFSNLDSEEMTTEEALYYAEVSSRITAKLLEIQ